MEVEGFCSTLSFFGAKMGRMTGLEKRLSLGLEERQRWVDLSGIVRSACNMRFLTVYACKLSDQEHPLYLRLVAGPRTDTLSFVLREHEIGEVSESRCGFYTVWNTGLVLLLQFRDLSKQGKWRRGRGGDLALPEMSPKLT